MVFALTGIGLAWWLLSDSVVPALLRLFPGDGLSLAQAGALMVGGLVVLWLIVLVHELGHVSGGLAAGFRFVLLAAGPIVFARRSGLSLNRSLATFAGLAVSVPHRPETEGLAGRMALVVAGGPAASLIVGLTAVLVALSMTVSGGTQSVVRALIALFGLGSTLTGAATLIPVTAGGIPNDGARLWRLLRPSHPGRAREAALLAVGTQELSGVRPENWSADLLAQSLHPADGTVYHFHALAFNLRHRLATGQTDTDRLRQALSVASAMGGALRIPAVELAANHARASGQESIAREWERLLISET
ncbi:MAG: hypothetical protein JJ896_11130 [Rhodothermales bacterium]|nr:hypothetical protein [Rhodothermales bacterium]MBO6780194.1 hypothetical protein [Rhodothermales bacterium]